MLCLFRKTHEAGQKTIDSANYNEREEIIMKKSENWRKFMALGMIVTLIAGFTAGCGTTADTSKNTVTSETESATAATQSAENGDSALLQKIKEKGYITIATSNDAPFAYTDVDTNKPAGIDVEILKEICKRMGIGDIKLQVVDFSNLLVELNNGSVDMVADGMYIKDERLKVAYFSDAWYTEGEAIVLPEDTDIKSFDDLKGKNIAAQPGTTFYDTAQAWVDAGKAAKLDSYDNQANLITAVNLGKTDAAVTDGVVAGYTIANDNTLKVKLLEGYEPEATGIIGSAVRFEDKDFMKEFNKVLNEMKEDGSLLKILKDYGLNEDYFVDVKEGYTKNIE